LRYACQSTLEIPIFERNDESGWEEEGGGDGGVKSLKKTM